MGVPVAVMPMTVAMLRVILPCGLATAGFGMHMIVMVGWHMGCQMLREPARSRTPGRPA